MNLHPVIQSMNLDSALIHLFDWNCSLHWRCENHSNTSFLAGVETPVAQIQLLMHIHWRVQIPLDALSLLSKHDDIYMMLFLFMCTGEWKREKPKPSGSRVPWPQIQDNAATALQWQIRGIINQRDVAALTASEPDNRRISSHHFGPIAAKSHRNHMQWQK